MSPNANSVNSSSVKAKMRRLICILENNVDWDWDTFIQTLNEFRMELDLELSIDMLKELCELYCSDDGTIIHYKNRKVVVIGANSGNIIDIVYYCKTDKTVKQVDYNCDDEEEIIELINMMD